MDSRQIYRGMDIGTDKVSTAHRGRVPHHGLDVLDPDEFYSAGQFGRDARRWIEEITGRGRVPLLVGGTGLFLRSLTHPIFEQPKIDAARLETLRGFMAKQPRSELDRWVGALDSGRADLAREGGPQRLGRTIEVALLTGRPLSWWHSQGSPDDEPLDGLIVVLDRDREELDRRIDARVARMVADGLVEEVKGLLEKGYGPEDPGMTGTGLPGSRRSPLWGHDAGGRPSTGCGLKRDSTRAGSSHGFATNYRKTRSTSILPNRSTRRWRGWWRPGRPRLERWADHDAKTEQHGKTNPDRKTNPDGKGRGSHEDRGDVLSDVRWLWCRSHCAWDRARRPGPRSPLRVVCPALPSRTFSRQGFLPRSRDGAVSPLRASAIRVGSRRRAPRCRAHA